MKLSQDQIDFLAVLIMHNSMRLRYVGPPVFRRHRWHDAGAVIRRIYGRAV